MTRAQVAALGHPDGIILDKAVAVVKAVKQTAKQQGVDTTDERLTILLQHIKLRPTAYTGSRNDKSVRQLAWAWLGARQEPVS